MTQATLRQLRYFNALARHGHFGRAAEACAISQPALSMQIKELEEALGGVLLERSARHVALTRFGEEAAPRVRDSCAWSMSWETSRARRATGWWAGCASA